MLNGLTEEERVGASNEAKLLAELKYPCIIGLIESFYKESTLYIAMELCSGGDLSGIIESQQRIRAQSKQQDAPVNFFQEHMIMTFFIQIALGVRYIHRRNILHRDLKTKNIFITGDNVIKLGDFGISKVLDSTEAFARTVVGTPYYLSPEICEGNAYSKASDVWSLGCVLYEMVTLSHAFNGQTLPALVITTLLKT